VDGVEVDTDAFTVTAYVGPVYCNTDGTAKNPEPSFPSTFRTATGTLVQVLSERTEQQAQGRPFQGLRVTHQSEQYQGAWILTYSTQQWVDFVPTSGASSYYAIVDPTTGDLEWRSSIDGSLTGAVNTFAKFRDNGVRLLNRANALCSGATAPGAPAISANFFSRNSYTVTITRAADDGGSPITHYSVYRERLVSGNYRGGVVGSIRPPGTSYHDRGNWADGKYRYYVTAWNAVGEGPRSNITPRIQGDG